LPPPLPTSSQGPTIFLLCVSCLSAPPPSQTRDSCITVPHNPHTLAHTHIYNLHIFVLSLDKARLLALKNAMPLLTWTWNLDLFAPSRGLSALTPQSPLHSPLPKKNLIH
ncbi:hypothetical protein COCC4DRAFT_135906, partial [Bipolaris maydis ATCC 48331]